MSTMDKRKDALENKFFHDEELKFKLESRTRKFFGLWAAEKMHMDEDEGLEYALSIVREGVKGDGAVIAKVYTDMREHSVNVPEHELHEKIAELRSVAAHKLQKELEADAAGS